MLVYTLQTTFGMVPHVQSPEKGHNLYASVNIPLKSYFILFSRRILVTKDTVPNIITNGYIINNYVLKFFFSVYVLKIKKYLQNDIVH